MLPAVDAFLEILAPAEAPVLALLLAWLKDLAKVMGLAAAAVGLPDLLPPLITLGLQPIVCRVYRNIIYFE